MKYLKNKAHTPIYTINEYRCSLIKPMPRPNHFQLGADENHTYIIEEKAKVKTLYLNLLDVLTDFKV